MATSRRGSGVVGYNVQSIVNTEHYLIIRGLLRTSCASIPVRADTTAIGGEKANRRQRKPFLLTRLGHGTDRNFQFCDEPRRLLAPHKLRTPGGGFRAGLHVTGADAVSVQNAPVIVTLAVGGDPRE